MVGDFCQSLSGGVGKCALANADSTQFLMQCVVDTCRSSSQDPATGVTTDGNCFYVDPNGGVHEGTCQGEAGATSAVCGAAGSNPSQCESTGCPDGKVCRDGVCTTAPNSCDGNGDCLFVSANTGDQTVGVCVSGSCQPNPCLNPGCSGQCSCVATTSNGQVSMGICGENGLCVGGDDGLQCTASTEENDCRRADGTFGICKQGQCRDERCARCPDGGCECVVNNREGRCFGLECRANVAGGGSQCGTNNDMTDCVRSDGSTGFCVNGVCADEQCIDCEQGGCECERDGVRGECAEFQCRVDPTVNPNTNRCLQEGCAGQCECTTADGLSGRCGDNGNCEARPELECDQEDNDCERGDGEFGICKNGRCRDERCARCPDGGCDCEINNQQGECVEFECRVRNVDPSENPCERESCAGKCDCRLANDLAGVCGFNGECKPREVKCSDEEEPCEYEGRDGVCHDGVCRDPRCVLHCPDGGCECELPGGDIGQCREFRCVPQVQEPECEEDEPCESPTVPRGGMCVEGRCRDNQCLDCAVENDEECRCELANGEGVCARDRVCRPRATGRPCEGDDDASDCVTEDGEQGTCDGRGNCVRRRNGQCADGAGDCVLVVGNSLQDGVCVRGQCVEEQCHRNDGGECKRRDADDDEEGVCRMGRCVEGGCRDDSECNNFFGDADFADGAADDERNSLEGGVPQFRLECRDGRCVEPKRGSDACDKVLCRNNGRCQAIALEDLGLSEDEAAEIEDALLFDRVNGLLVRCACDDAHTGILCENKVQAECECRDNQICVEGDCVDQSRKEVCNSEGRECECISGRRNDDGECEAPEPTEASSDEELQRERFTVTWARGTSLLEAVANVRALFDDDVVKSIKVVARKNDAGFVEVVVALSDDVDELDSETDSALKRAVEEASQRTDVIDVAQIKRDTSLSDAPTSEFSVDGASELAVSAAAGALALVAIF